MKEPLIDRLERKLKKITIRNLMLFIVVGTALVWLLDYIVYFKTGVDITYYLRFYKELILQGQVWRLITFIFVPDSYSLLTLAISLYFYWLIGTGLENEWGSFRFDLYYVVGWLCAIISGFITGYATVEYLHMSMFIAYAILNPEERILLFYFLPVKMKWLAILDVVVLVLSFIFNLYGWPGRIALLVALLNLIFFFTKGVVIAVRAAIRRRKWKRQVQNRGDDYPFDL